MSKVFDVKAVNALVEKGKERQKEMKKERQASLLPYMKELKKVAARKKEEKNEEKKKKATKDKKEQ